MGRDDEVGEPGPRNGWERPEDGGRARDASHAPAGDTPGAAGETDPLRRDPASIRAEDTEPYIGLQYVARLFKIVALIVVVAIIAEVVAGLMYEGLGAGFNLFAEVIQGGVLAAMLWGAGDLTLLFIDVGHDVRAARVLLGRMSARMNADMGSTRSSRPERPANREARQGDQPPA